MCVEEDVSFTNDELLMILEATTLTAKNPEFRLRIAAFMTFVFNRFKFPRIDMDVFAKRGIQITSFEMKDILKHWNRQKAFTKRLLIESNVFPMIVSEAYVVREVYNFLHSRLASKNIFSDPSLHSLFGFTMFPKITYNFTDFLGPDFKEFDQPPRAHEKIFIVMISIKNNMVINNVVNFFADETHIIPWSLISGPLAFFKFNSSFVKPDFDIFKAFDGMKIVTSDVAFLSKYKYHPSRSFLEFKKFSQACYIRAHVSAIFMNRSKPIAECARLFKYDHALYTRIWESESKGEQLRFEMATSGLDMNIRLACAAGCFETHLLSPKTKPFGLTSGVIRKYFCLNTKSPCIRAEAEHFYILQRINPILPSFEQSQ